MSKAAELFDKYAEEYQSLYMNVELYKNSLDFFCNKLRERGTVLELACGPGNVTKYLIDKRPDLKILATDLSENMLTLAKANVPKANFKKLDCRVIDQLEEKYNGIVAAFCLPYLSKTEIVQLIEDCSQKLLPEGILYLSTIEGKYSKSGIEVNSKGDSLQMYYYLEDDLNKILMDDGFELLFADQKSYTSKGKEVTDLMIIACKCAQ